MKRSVRICGEGWRFSRGKGIHRSSLCTHRYPLAERWAIFPSLQLDSGRFMLLPASAPDCGVCTAGILRTGEASYPRNRNTAKESTYFHHEVLDPDKQRCCILSAAFGRQFSLIGFRLCISVFSWHCSICHTTPSANKKRTGIHHMRWELSATRRWLPIRRILCLHRSMFFP